MPGTGVFYGRMNPFTRGHKAAVHEIKSLGLKPVIIVTHSQNAEKNPLTVNEKINLIRKSLKNVNIEVFATSLNEPKLHTILGKLRNRGNTNIQVFLGANRIKGIGKYVEGSGYTAVQFGGARSSSGNNLAGVSGTRARTAAVAGNTATFNKMMSNQLSPNTKRLLMNLIKSRMNSAATSTGAKRSRTTSASSKRSRG
jgi:cytidyltransferase-like protein